jgi:hypothetical protein
MIGVAALFAILAVAPVRALEVALAPLVQHQEAGGASRSAPVRAEADLLREIEARGPGQALTVRRLTVPESATPRSVLDAARVAQAHGCSLLLYGFLKQGEGIYQAEVKLYDGERDRVAAVFYASDDGAHYHRLIADLAVKIVEYFRDDVGLAPGRRSEPERAVGRLACGVGYWTPLASPWDRVTAGLACVSVGARFVPVRPLFAIGRFPAHAAFGVDVCYAVGVNERDYEAFVLHSMRVRLPVEMVLDLRGGHAAGFAVGPLLQIDSAAQDRLYDHLFVGTAIALGASAVLTYRYELSDRAALGFAHALDFAAYRSPLLTYSPSLVADWKLGSRKGGPP